MYSRVSQWQGPPASERARQSVNRALKTGTFGASHLPPTAPPDPCEPRLHSFVQSVFTPAPINTPRRETEAPPGPTNRSRAFKRSALAYNPRLFVILRRNADEANMATRTANA